MKYISNYNKFLLEQKEEETWMKRPDWLVYDKNWKVLDFNLDFKKASKVAIDKDYKSLHKMIKQGGITFEDLEKAKDFLKKEYEKIYPPKKKEYEKKSVTKSQVLKSISNFVQKYKPNHYFFTYCISKIFKELDLLFISKIEHSEDKKDIEHSYVIVDGKYFDQDGFHTKSDLIKYWNMSKWSFDVHSFEKNIDFILDNNLIDKQKDSEIIITYIIKKRNEITDN